MSKSRISEAEGNHLIARITIDAITTKTLKYWRQEVKKPEIVEIAKGKEIGHKLADPVDE